VHSKIQFNFSVEDFTLSIFASTKKGYFENDINKTAAYGYWE